MKSNSYAKLSISVAVLVLCGIAGGLVYANLDALQSALSGASSHAHSMRGPAAASGDGDSLGCHRHGTVTYHCH